VSQLLPFYEIIFTYTEWLPEIVAVFAVLLVCARPWQRKWLIGAHVAVVAGVLIGGIFDSKRVAAAHGYDMSLPSMRQALETYIRTGNGNVTDIIEGHRYPPVHGLQDFTNALSWSRQSAMHNTDQDASLVPEAYNKGDDWFESTLGEPMVYTGAIYAGPNESMWKGQLNKLEYIAQALGVKAGDRALDIGCGWGRLANHMASKGAFVTGITLAEDQKKYAERMSATLGNNVKILKENFFEVDLPERSFDVISSVEMAEHVGLRNYRAFLRKVHSLLVDNGTFYIQVAGLPRGYSTTYNHHEDIAWGLFMSQHVFPGADASCPMGWVLTQLEKTAWEVQSSLNLGNHYSQTLNHWLQTWESKRAAVVEVYGERSWRRWQVFLKWSVRVARTGGSTVQFITATKSGNEQARIAAQERLAPGTFQIPPDTPCPGGGPSR